MTLNGSWGYNEADTDWKSPRQVIETLVRCASGGGNLLLNIGPKADGTVPPESERILRQVGDWLKNNGASIYGTDRSPFFSSTGMTTLKGNTVFAHVLRWPGRQLTIPRILNQVRSVHMLHSGESVVFEQRGDRVMLDKLPARAPDALDTVIVLELDGAPRALDYFEDGWDASQSPGSGPQPS